MPVRVSTPAAPVRRLLRELAAEHLGDCPACGRPVVPDGHCIRLHGSFFHTRCALYRRADDREAA